MINELKREIFNDTNKANYHQIKKILELCHTNRKLLVTFAYNCAKDLEQYYDAKEYPKIYQTRQKCLKLLGELLADFDNKIANKKFIEKLKAAANAAEAAYATYAAGYAATNAAHSADCAAANAVYSAANAAYHADYAADAAGYAADSAFREKKLKELYFQLAYLVIEEYNLCNKETYKLLYL